MAELFLKANLDTTDVEALALILERAKNLLLDAKKLLPSDKIHVLEGWTQLALHGKVRESIHNCPDKIAESNGYSALDTESKTLTNSRIQSSASSVPCGSSAVPLLKAKLPSSDGTPSSVDTAKFRNDFKTPRDDGNNDNNNLEGPQEDGLLPSGLFDPQPPVSYDYLARKNGHARDSRLTFHAESHKYFLDDSHTFGVSVTGVCGNFGDEFKTDLIIHRMINGKNWPRDDYMVEDGCDLRPMTKGEIKQKWDFGRDDAGNRGTYMHSLIEWLLTDPRTMMYVTEIKMFFNFYEAYLTNITPYRLEWRIFDEELDVAGSVDFVGS